MNILRNPHTGSRSKSQSNSRARIALTIGDPAGIGTEIILKSLVDRTLLALDAEFTVFGDQRYLRDTYDLLRNHGNLLIADPDRLDIVDISTN